MSINKLPVDVLYRIMKLACVLMRGFSISRGSMLPLVHCCRYWRMVGTPIAYRHLEVSDRRDDTIKSNARLIANVNDTTVAKTAILKFERCMDVAQVMHAVCDNLVANNERNWKAIHTLYIHLNLTNIPYIEGVAPYDAMLDNLNRYIGQFTLLVPNVKVLNIRVMAVRELDPIYAGKVVALYSKQLTALEGAATIFSKEPLHMPFVRHLDINWSSSRPPCAIQVDASLVTEVSLCLVSSSFSWEVFAGTQNKRSQPLVFSSMRRLTLIFDMSRTPLPPRDLDLWNDQTSQLSRVSFPRLESLITNACSVSAVMLKEATLPKRLKVFQIHVDSDVCITYNNATLNSNVLNRLHDALNPRTNEGDLLIAVQMLCGINNIAQNASAHISSTQFIEDSHEFVWPNLQSIDVEAAVQPEMAFTIFQKFTSVTMMRFVRLRTDRLAICSIANMLRCKEWSGLEPYNTKINKLVLHTGLGRNTLMAAFFVYIAIRLPGLEEMKIMGCYIDAYEKCKSKWQTEYPHLANIRSIDICS